MILSRTTTGTLLKTPTPWPTLEPQFSITILPVLLNQVMPLINVAVPLTPTKPHSCLPNET